MKLVPQLSDHPYQDGRRRRVRRLLVEAETDFDLIALSMLVKLLGKGETTGDAIMHLVRLFNLDVEREEVPPSDEYTRPDLRPLPASAFDVPDLEAD